MRSICFSPPLPGPALRALTALLSLLGPLAEISRGEREAVGHLQGEMAGEVTASTVILQTRLTKTQVNHAGDLLGSSGITRFQWANNDRFENAQHTPWRHAHAEQDWIVKTKISGLEANTTYFYRIEFGPDQKQAKRGETREFQTLCSPDTIARHHFVVVTGMNYAFFHHGDGKKRPAYSGKDKHLGYPALKSILDLRPDFFVGTGDNVYYDHPQSGRAQTAQAMRKKWHQQFIQPRFVNLFGSLATYWEKDDHDFRLNDSDNSGDYLPDRDLGIAIFREQVPIVEPNDRTATTYRTHRAGKLLQLWFTENRDYRSDNKLPDNAQKTIWGDKQKKWLQRSLLASDATFKILVSPTPMIGPDGASKIDNHCNFNGFRHERDTFFAWASKHNLLNRGLYLICGDRHWQYHSIDPSGMEEFSCGALIDANSRLGIKPGIAKSTDPEGRVRQPYTSRNPSGGFLSVVIEPNPKQAVATLRFEFYDEHRKLLHSVEKRRAYTNTPTE